jgi:hypothetical protein
MADVIGFSLRVGDLRHRRRRNPAPNGAGTSIGDPERVISDSPGRWGTAALVLLVLIPIGFNALVLLPELRKPVPSLNDDAVHYLLIQEASAAFATGGNPFDHWVPELELGFPQFFYYQHLPHLTVILLHRLLLQKVDLLTLFNLIRYLLLLGFPLTVYWSMRQIGFSVVAGAVSAAAASLLSANHRYGFEYDSYIWRGLGMYTQLWAMHVSFITVACLHRVLERGTGYAAAVFASSVLALSHLVYAYMMVVTALVLCVVGLNRANARPRITRLAVIAALAAVITSYFWLPFLLFKAYLSASPYLQRWKYDSFGASEILTWLVNGDLLDYGRLPVLTVLLALGVASALFARTRPARLALLLFLVWLALYFGRPTWGRLADLLPMHEGLLLHRFIGGVHLGAILLVGLGGEWLWQQFPALPDRWRAVTTGLVLLVLMAPALRERHEFYTFNTQWIDRTRKALEVDGDARAILTALQQMPPGRTYAGLRANWGKDLQFGDLRFTDLLTFHRIPAVSPPYQGLSLNADLIWHFDDRNPAHYSVFNARYVIAPRNLPMPAFLRPTQETRRYTLYRTDTRGYGDFIAVADLKTIASQSSLLALNRGWLSSPDPAAARFIRYDYPSGADSSQRAAAEAASASPGRACPGDGVISEERVLSGQLSLRVECPEASTVVLKVTYHPNWRVTIDGQEASTFMVSPSFIGLNVPAGPHHIRAQYRSPIYKTALFLLGACTFFAMIWLRGQFSSLDAIICSKRRSSAREASLE